LPGGDQPCGVGLNKLPKMSQGIVLGIPLNGSVGGHLNNPPAVGATVVLGAIIFIKGKIP